MGCHAWFKRPITDDEFNLMKAYAVYSAEKMEHELVEYYANEGLVYNIDQAFIDAVARSVETGEPQTELYNSTWYQLGYGSDNPELGEDFSVSYKNGTLYVDCPEYHNTARVSIGIYTYPRKNIHNKHELRRYIRKRYFNITSEEHAKLDEFWKKYPDGIMEWG